MDTRQAIHRAIEPSRLLHFYRSVRSASRELTEPLTDADATVQSMPDASPAKWHLAHTTWFFETMVLVPNVPGYRVFDKAFNFLFNSYYETIGARQARPKRGLITRPSLDEIYAYRSYVDAAVDALLIDGPRADVANLVELGCHHEQQHQELLLTDILHLFSQNPLKLAYKTSEPIAVRNESVGETKYHAFEGGVVEIGHAGPGFSFDSEGPRHRILVDRFQLADRLVTNAHWMEFIADGGYRKPLLWLSEGWTKVRAEDWTGPLYWDDRDGEAWTMTLRGAQPVDGAAPVDPALGHRAQQRQDGGHPRAAADEDQVGVVSLPQGEHPVGAGDLDLVPGRQTLLRQQTRELAVGIDLDHELQLARV